MAQPTQQAAAWPGPFPTWPPPSGGYPNTKWEGGISLVGPPGRTFPAGAAIGGGGTTINPNTLSIVRTIGVKLNG